MRTTLDIDDDLLMAAKEMARREHTSTGKIVSLLLRQAITRPVSPDARDDSTEPEVFYGFRPFATRGGVVTNELVERLREEEGV